MRSIQYLYAPFSILGLSMMLFLEGTTFWYVYVYACIGGYPLLSILWKIASGFDNSFRVFLYDLVTFFIAGLLVFANIYKASGILGPDEIISHKPLDMLYFSIVTWTTVGYGDFKPTESVRIIASIQALIGYVYNAVFLGLIAGGLLIRYQQNVNNKSSVD